jgi:hypothetical protein
LIPLISIISDSFRSLLTLPSPPLGQDQEECHRLSLFLTTHSRHSDVDTRRREWDYLQCATISAVPTVV